MQTQNLKRRISCKVKINKIIIKIGFPTQFFSVVPIFFFNFMSMLFNNLPYKELFPVFL